MWCRGIRGAITVSANTREEILNATQELLQALVLANGIQKDDVACAILTTTPDLNAEFPALAARRIGWTETALLCGHEMEVPGSLNKCIRILIMLNTEKAAKDMVHVYLRGAEILRPDVVNKNKNTNKD
ncbi:MAG: chorismate mutase [Dehalococcoidia bacterium]|nr:chorismate mutase [Dehalococcoidia bacterium]